MQTPIPRSSTVPRPVLQRMATLVAGGLSARAPVTLQILGKTLLHAVIVGAVVGVVSLVFVEGLDLTQHWVLTRLAGYLPLRAAGEGDPSLAEGPSFRPWLLLVLPASDGAARVGEPVCALRRRFSDARLQAHRLGPHVVPPSSDSSWGVGERPKAAAHLR